jgi:membrane-bound metal-dependent hydrolase YbcI (DUF457 family)
MGRSHAASGWCIGLVAAPLLGLVHAPAVLLFAVTTAGFALLPDLDCDGSRASRSLGWFTGGISTGLQWLSARVYRWTRTPHDSHRQGTHRHLSHTVVFALVLGGTVTLGAATIGRWFVLAVLIFGVLLAENALGVWMVRVAGAVMVVLVATTSLATTLVAVGWWIGPAVAIGCVTHCLGDSPTRSGCPFLWPIPIRGRAWYEISLPRRFRFTTGREGGFELRVAYPAFLVAGVLLVPGVWSVLVAVVDHLVVVTATASTR